MLSLEQTAVVATLVEAEMDRLNELRDDWNRAGKCVPMPHLAYESKLRGILSQLGKDQKVSRDIMRLAKEIRV